MITIPQHVREDLKLLAKTFLEHFGANICPMVSEVFVDAIEEVLQGSPQKQEGI